MDFTKSFIKAKNPCTDGFRWYLRHHRDGSDYQQVLDELVLAGRTQDACWLLDQLGPTSAVLRVDRLDCESLVFAGTVEVLGGIEVDGILRTGGSLLCGGPIRAQGEVRTGGDLRAAGGLQGAAAVRCGGLFATDWHAHVDGPLVADELKARGNLSCGALTVAGAAVVKGDLVVLGDCSAKALNARSVHTDGFLRLQQGLICAEHVRCGGHLEAGLGIRAGGDIQAAGSIRVGEGAEAEGEIRAGPGYGIFAGLCVQTQDWQSSARVRARRKPIDLLSGCWVDDAVALDTRPNPGGGWEVRHAH